MSIISELKDRVTKAPAPADITFMLSQAQDALDHLQEDYGAAALSAIDNAEGQKALDAIKQKIAGQRDRIEMLKAALVTAERQADELVQAQRKSLQKSQYLAASKHLDLMNTAAASYQKAISEAATAYRTMHEHSNKARAACPLLTEYPGFALSESELIRLAAGEAYRHVSPPGGGKFANADLTHALPGAQFSDLAFKENPDAMPPIEETVRQTNEDVKAALKRQLIP